MGDIKFIGKKRKTSSSSDSLCHLHVPAKKYDARTVLPTQSESDELFSSLGKCDGAKPAVLAIVFPYCDRYIPAALAEDLPLVLSDLYQKQYLSLGYSSLLQAAHNIQLSLTTVQAKVVEAKTREQAESRFGTECKLEESLLPISHMLAVLTQLILENFNYVSMVS